MVTTTRRKREHSYTDLQKSIGRFVSLLQTEGEEEACVDLAQLSKALEEDSSEDHRAAIAQKILDCFDGEHELFVYTLPRKGGEAAWERSDELFVVSTSVRNLAKRIARA